MQPSANANQLAAAGYRLQVLLHDALDEQHHQTIHRNRNADCKQCRDGVALQKLIEHMIAAKCCTAMAAEPIIGLRKLPMISNFVPVSLLSMITSKTPATR